MAYFNHAFCKSSLVTEIPLRGAVAGTQDLTAGQLGIFEGTWGSNLDPDPSAYTAVAKNLIYIAQGSFIESDKVGTHGGYKESVKTKGINPRYITRLWASSCQEAEQSTVTVEVGSTCAPCGENLFLRLDVKGSPALRFLNHNAYAIGDSSGSAALNNDLPGICCAEGQEFLDPAVALAKAAGMLLEDPIVSPFIAESTSVTGLVLGAVAGTGYSTAQNVATTGGTGSGLTLNITATAGNVTAVTINTPGSGYTNGDVVTIVQGGGASDNETVTLTVEAGHGMAVSIAGVTTVYTIAEVLDGTYVPSADPVTDEVTASVQFVGAYVDTRFGDCTFDTRDFYEKEPVQLVASLLDETGDPCNDCGVVTSTPGIMQQTSGETVLRDLLLTERYMQNPYHQGSFDGFRMNEIGGFDPLKGAVDRTALYKVYYLQHSIPRLNNPTGVFDNDQYIYKFYVECDEGTDGTPTFLMDTLFDGLAHFCTTVYGNPLIFEDLVDEI